MESIVNLDRQIEATEQYLALGAVALVGAGLSIDSRFPMTGGLSSLLWEALDAAPEARALVAATLARPDGPSKGLIGDSWAKALVAWDVVARNSTARRRFQDQFSALDSERAALPSPAHEALARLVHAGVVECVVSLNWDTAFEQAYRRLYGVAVPAGVLFKPHGDAGNPQSEWTLPHEPGRVPPTLSAVVQRLVDGHARTLLIVGYSERDQIVVDQLVSPLDVSWRTIRISPNASGSDDLAIGAEIALPRLADTSAHREEVSSWHTVTYQGSRDIRAALSGQRLGPRDVDACPQLAEVNSVTHSLRTEHAVILNGATGSGKSITAYQALRQLSEDGYETLRLRDNSRGNGIRTWLADLRTFPRKKILFLDDAQDMSPDTVRELTEHANGETLVLVVGIDHISGGVRTFSLSASSAVARLARWVRMERETLFPLIRNLDSNVGNHPSDLFFDRRIDSAERQATPWHFFYTLTGGWRRIRQSAIELRDAQRADLALLAVAVAQIAGVDAGVDLRSLTILSNELGCDDSWLTNSLLELKAKGLVMESDGRLRCAHLQSAYSVISWMLHPTPWNATQPTRPVVPPIPSAALKASKTEAPLEIKTMPMTTDLAKSELDSDREAVCRLIRSSLDNPATPLRGLTWLSGSGLNGDERSLLRWKGVFGPERDKQLAVRALAISPDGDVAAAAQLLSQTIAYSHDGEVVAAVKSHDGRVREWFASIVPENAWALGDLVNSLHQPDGDYAAQVARYTDAERLSILALDGGWPHSTSTGHALGSWCFSFGGVVVPGLGVSFGKIR